MIYVYIPDKIDDQFIIQLFTMKNNRNKINPSRTKLSFINRFISIKYYLDNRYSDSDSYLETIYRIVNKIEYKPKCLYCGKTLQFNKKYHFMSYCSQVCVQNSLSVKEKKRYTYALHSEVQNKDIVDRRKKTMLDRYGKEHASQVKQFMDKAKQTNIEKLGCEFTAQSDICKQKMKQTCLQRYGVTHNFLIPEVHDKIINKFLQNHNGISSKLENDFYEYLLTKFNKDHIKRQYKSELYPFLCDFYISDIDLYIELQGYWTHGKHPFNVNNENDLSILNEWKSHNNSHYDNAVYTWTESDVKKRTIAFNNKLNYIEIFSSDLNTVINKFEKEFKLIYGRQL